MRVPEANVWAPQEVPGNLVVDLWKIGLVEPTAIDDVLAVGGVSCEADHEPGPFKQ